MDSLLNTSPLPEPTTEHQQTPTPPQAKSPESASESGHRRPSQQGTRPPEPELLPCPRCDSTNTKFCYYNNYNLSQPRHYCKSCRRYWTRGGALRNVPVGGGSRKNPSSSNKRPRISAAGTSSDSSIVSCSNNNDVARKTQDADPVALNSDLGLFSGAVDGARSLSCWIGGGGFFPFNGNGFGLLPGLDYGTGLLDWPAVEQVNNREDGGGSMAVSGESPGCGTWQIGGGGAAAEGSVAEGTDHYISWPDLAISTSAKALK